MSPVPGLEDEVGVIGFRSSGLAPRALLTAAPVGADWACVDPRNVHGDPDMSHNLSRWWATVCAGLEGSMGGEWRPTLTVFAIVRKVPRLPERLRFFGREIFLRLRVYDASLEMASWRYHVDLAVFRDRVADQG